MTQLTPKRCTEPLRWALESEANPSLAAADWLACDIDSSCSSAVELLTNPNASLEHLEQAKDVYKTMRIVGETSGDRRMGARLYLGAIAGALAIHRKRITRQSDVAITRALRTMLEDKEAPESLRMVAGKALAVLEEHIALHEPGKTHTQGHDDTQA